MNVRILMVHRYGSTKGGAESYLRALTDGLSRRGHTVALAAHLDRDASWAAVRDGAMLAAASSIESEPSPTDRDELARVLGSFRPDVVHVHNVEATWLPAAIAAVVPTVLAIHDHRVSCPTSTRYWTAWKRGCGIQPGLVCLGYNAVAHCGSYRANATLRPYRRWRAWRAAAMAVPRLHVFSAYMASTLALAGVPRERVAVTPYPVPPFPAAAPIPPEARPVVSASGRLTREKGFSVLLDSLEHVRTPVLCAIAGSGHEAQALGERAADVPARHEVRFLGWLAPDLLTAWLASSAVVAMPSAWPEPFGIAGLEAMASGKAVVATNVGGVGEWLEDGVTGLSVAPHDAAAFGSAMQRLLDDEALRRRLGDAAKDRAIHRFALEPHLDAVESLYTRADEGTVPAA